MVLTEGKKGNTYQILEIPPLPELKNIGIYPGKKVKFRFQYPFSGPVIIQVYRRDYAISGTLAKQIRIKEL